MLAMLLALTGPASIDNGHVVARLNDGSGQLEIVWPGVRLSKVYGETVLADGRIVETTSFSHHEATLKEIRDHLGKGLMFTVRHWNRRGELELHQTVWVYDQRPEVITRLDVHDPAGGGVRQIAPVIVGQNVKLATVAPVNSLFVPYDNDKYVRYRSDGWDEMVGSHEVGAIYDDTSRQGLVVGSVEHDTWKSAVKFTKAGALRATAGITSVHTHDQSPHGTVSGKVVRSPRFLLGLYPDWRTGMERYGNVNANIQPALAWTGSVPFGWNSWSGHKSKVTFDDAIAATNFVHDRLPLLRSGNTATINLDSFWDNLTKAQRIDFIRRCHEKGLKAGIYWTPFVNWGEPEWNSPIAGYKYADLQLKSEDGKLLPKLSGGWPLDPTHPGTLQRIDQQLKEFVDMGFDYVKFDFMTHGSLEGKHFDPKVQTGTQAYNVGMKRIVADLSRAKAGRPIFISLSIAPLFPQGYAHSRRTSCDVFGNIGATEYFLNSQNYGWWAQNRLYRFSDPDSACVYQASGEAPTTDIEAQTRMTASVIGGGMIIEGDDLTKPEAQTRVLSIFGNQEVLDLARRTPIFRPVRGTTGERAGETFINVQDARNATFAAFNFGKDSGVSITVPLRDLGLANGIWELRDLWTGKVTESTREAIHFQLGPTASVLVKMTKRE